jgi:putative membrane protein
MNLSITMISGLTEPFVEASYTATVTNASIPPVTLSLVPVLVESNPSSAAQLEALRGGADTGQELASNGELLDENVLALAEGARGLVNGILQLRDGAGELSAGLVNDAAPGSVQLADGLGELQSQVPALADGVGQLNAGGNDLEDGLAQLQGNVPALVTGVDQLNDGAADLAAGLRSGNRNDPGLFEAIVGLDGGLKQLSDAVDTLPDDVRAQLKNDPQYQELLAGLQTIIDGLDGIGQAIGTKPAVPVADPETLGQAIRSLEFGLSNPACDPTNPTDPANPCGIKEVVGLVAGQLGAAAAAGGDLDLLIQASIGSYQQAVSALPPTAGTACPQDPAVPVPPVVPPSVLESLGFAPNDICVLLSNVVYGLALDAGVIAPDDLGGVKAQTQAAASALDQVVGAIGDSATDGTVLNGLSLVWLGLSNPMCDVANPTDPANPCGIKEITGALSGGASQILAGVPVLVDAILDGIQQQLSAAIGAPTPGCDPTATLRCLSASIVDGIATASNGADQVSDGLSQLNAQTGPLADGVDQLADGSVTLSDGLEELNNNVAPLGDGVNQLADGANQLADGLGDAADGSVQLSSGLQDAAEAAPALPQGAERLSAEGTQLLIEAGEDTAQSFGEQVAMLEASAERTADGGLPFGGPQGAIVAAAYRYDLSAATGATAQNTGQLIAAAVIAGAAVAGATVLARRKTA